MRTAAARGHMHYMAHQMFSVVIDLSSGAVLHLWLSQLITPEVILKLTYRTIVMLTGSETTAVVSLFWRVTLVHHLYVIAVAVLLFMQPNLRVQV